MATFTRLAGTLYTAENPRCDGCDETDADGFAVQRPTDPEGARCWAPRYSMRYVECEGCGGPVDPAPWERECDGINAPHHSLGCGHSPRNPDYYINPPEEVAA